MSRTAGKTRNKAHHRGRSGGRRDGSLSHRPLRQRWRHRPAIEQGSPARAGGDPDASARKLAQLPRPDGPQRRRSRSDIARRRAAFGRRGRGRCHRRGGHTDQDWRPNCRLLPPAVVRRADQARLSDRPARCQPRRDAGGIRGFKRGGARTPAEPPLLRGGRDFALRGGDRLGGADGPSAGDRRRHGLDAGFGRRLGLCSAIRPDLGRASDRDDLDRGKDRGKG